MPGGRPAFDAVPIIALQVWWIRPGRGSALIVDDWKWLGKRRAPPGEPRHVVRLLPRTVFFMSRSLSDHSLSSIGADSAQQLYGGAASS
jgi:hypothetical protein